MSQPSRLRQQGWVCFPGGPVQPLFIMTRSLRSKEKVEHYWKWNIPFQSCFIEKAIIWKFFYSPIPLHGINQSRWHFSKKQQDGCILSAAKQVFTTLPVVLSFHTVISMMALTTFCPDFLSPFEFYSLSQISCTIWQSLELRQESPH